MRESLRRLASEDGMDGKGGKRRVRVELLDGDHVTIDLDVSTFDIPYLQAFIPSSLNL